MSVVVVVGIHFAGGYPYNSACLDFKASPTIYSSKFRFQYIEVL